MARIKGSPKTGGRQKGTTNARLKAIEEIIAKYDCNPIEGLCKVASGDWEGLGYDTDVIIVEKPDGDGSSNLSQKPIITLEHRLTAYKELCKYVYAQKKAVEHSTSEEGFKVILEDYTSKK